MADRATATHEAARAGASLAPGAPRTVLFAHSGGHWVRGSERCLLDLVAGVDRARFAPVVWCDGDGLARAAAELGVPVHRFEGAAAAGDALRPPPRLVREAHDLFARYDVRLAHANNMIPLRWLLPAARRARVPLLAHLHLLSTRDERRFLGVHQAALAVGVSAAAARGLLDDGMPRDRVAVIHNGVDPRRLDRGDARALRASLSIPDHAVVSTAVTSLIPIKGNDVLVDAVGELRRDADVEHHLLLVGDGPERRALEERAAAAGAVGRVHFLGERADAGAVLRDATDVAVTASRMEAFPLNTLEAAYFALPVVASSIAAHAESVLDGVTGVLVAPESGAAFADALRALGANAARRRALGEAGRARVLREFLVERYVRDFESTYERLMSRPPSAYGWLRGSTFPRVYWSWLAERLTARATRLLCIPSRRVPSAESYLSPTTAPFVALSTAARFAPGFVRSDAAPR